MQSGHWNLVPRGWATRILIFWEIAARSTSATYQEISISSVVAGRIKRATDVRLSQNHLKRFAG
jgi:hypothetical protein